jgi:hypothetical protein
MARLSDIICEEMCWAAKAAHSIESGYVRLETAEEGQYRLARIGDNAYFSCALFADGKHIPLPLLVPGGPVDTLQARVIEAARDDGLLDTCIDDCARFVLASGSHDDSLIQPSIDWLENRDSAFVFAALTYTQARKRDVFCSQEATKVAAASMKEICSLRGIGEVAP